MKDIFSIQDKIILVTGAFGLIGKEICFEFLKQKAKVILAGHRQTQVADIQKELETQFPVDQFLVSSIEITDLTDIEKCIDLGLQKFGAIDVLVNNAAIDAKFNKDNLRKIDNSSFESYPFELLKNSINVNTLGTIQVTQLICKQMLKQDAGNIINIGSTYSLVAPNQNLYDFGDKEVRRKPVDYVVSKSFLPNFTRYIATYYGKDNIRCNAIALHGVFDGHNEKFLSNFASLSPLGRMCHKSELKGPFVFLASEASSYMTGSTLLVDGGWTAW
jgi:NAD(P)-dependent dehydrogenase (short-subunit alcohol dehydrogenase family)